MILVADDDKDNRAIAAAALSAAGWRVALAEDGAQAVAAARREPPDLILMDLSMPVLDGYAATRQLKADAALGRIPVLALTAFALAGDEDRARAAGCDGYIAKPCLPSLIVSRVRAVLEGHHADRDRMP
ncbi:MAG: response regulator [Elusimicrobia bacterium]|nr:response regulator [Elusimicrobiota bacterium]